MSRIIEKSTTFIKLARELRNKNMLTQDNMVHVLEHEEHHKNYVKPLVKDMIENI